MRGPLGWRRLPTALAVSAALSGIATEARAARDAEGEIKEIESTTEGRSVLKEPLDRARQALVRARSMVEAGDGPHAALLSAVAAEWVDAARDLLRAVKAEAKAALAEKRLDDLETKLKRSRALLEETTARRGRARAVLEELEAAPTKPTPDPAPVEPAPKKKAGPKP